jgi:hypothetical protein
MTIDYCVLDGDPANNIAPRNPTVDDMGGAEFVDDDVYPPKETEQVTAGDVNQMEKLLVRACRMMPAASFWVSKINSTATLLGFKSQSDSLQQASILVTADTGAITIRFPLRKIRQGVVPPLLTFTRTNITSPAFASAVLSQSVDSTYCYVTARAADSTNAVLTSFSARIDIDGEGEFAI